MPHWEYVISTSDDTEHMNALGADGWELVAVVPMRPGDDPVRRHYFKRKIDGRRKSSKGVQHGA